MEFLTEAWHCLKKLEINPFNKVLTMERKVTFRLSYKYLIWMPTALALTPIFTFKCYQPLQWLLYLNILKVFRM